jgi:hypothetical protein
MALRHFVDGDCICIVDEDFTNLQESPAVFVLTSTPTGANVLHFGINAQLSQVFRDLLATEKAKQAERRYP